jgi:hypothetical protein
MATLCLYVVKNNIRQGKLFCKSFLFSFLSPFTHVVLLAEKQGGLKLARRRDDVQFLLKCAGVSRPYNKPFVQASKALAKDRPGVWAISLLV